MIGDDQLFSLDAVAVKGENSVLLLLALGTEPIADLFLLILDLLFLRILDDPELYVDCDEMLAWIGVTQVELLLCLLLEKTEY